LKIRVFALAKELEMDSKVLIDFCNRAGVHLKNSALASISPEERDTVIGFIRQETGGEPAIEVSAEPAAPSRDASRDVGGKIRQLQTSGVRATQSRTDESLEAQPLEPTPQADVADTPAVAEEQQGQEVEVEADDAVEPVGASDVDDAESIQVAEDAAEREGIPRRDGMGGSPSSMREMRPIGNMTNLEARSESGRQRKEQQKASLPAVAAAPELPTTPKKAVKTTESPAQKPVIPLTSDMYDKQGPLGDRLRGKDARGGKATAPSKRKTGSLLAQRRREIQMQQQVVPGTGRGRKTGRRTKRRSGPVELKTEAQIEFPITVRGLSEAIGRPAKALIQSLFKAGRMATINENLSEDESLQLAVEFGVDLEVKRGRDIEQELLSMLETDDPADTLMERAPIVTILGHVDHGKTTLLDRLRSANVAEGEVGGITQHIASYQVRHGGKKLTFVDTPGHAAFGEMRARGANVTDIVVLVVAANDGIMPQTVECISHAKSAGVPIVVAMNKMDLPEIDEQRVLQGLTAHEILPSEWGGDTEVVRTSAMDGTGLDNLLETLLLTAELHEYKTREDGPAVGVCLEAFRDEGRGALAWLIVQKGTLKVGDILLCGTAVGRVRAMYTDTDEEVQEAGPSQPVKVAGLTGVPGAGDRFFVMSDVEEARRVAEDRHEAGRVEFLARRSLPRTLEDILSAARDGAVQDLPLIIKADTPGSLEALRGEIDKFEHPEVRVKIVHEGVGGVNESDIYLASASGAIVVAFHVIAEDRAAQLAEQEAVDVRRYDIIYEVTEHIRLALQGMLRPDNVKVQTGRALVLQTFQISRFGSIAGCRVLNGTISRTDRMTVIRDQTILNDYPIGSLKREKDDTKEVREGMECGIRLEGFNDVKEGDLLEAFRVDQIERTLE
jgi:translation initiation factor IF-2